MKQLELELQLAVRARSSLPCALLGRKMCAYDRLCALGADDTEADPAHWAALRSARAQRSRRKEAPERGDRRPSGETSSLVVVKPWEPQRFMVVGTLMDAARNHGQVLLTYDSQAGRHVATKRIPNAWICACPEEFAQQHPQETERPWADVLAVASLTGAAFPYVCGLVGVYRDEESTYIVTELASEGDLFTFCNSPSGVCVGSLRGVSSGTFPVGTSNTGEAHPSEARSTHAHAYARAHAFPLAHLAAGRYRRP